MHNEIMKEYKVMTVTGGGGGGGGVEAKSDEAITPYLYAYIKQY